MRCFVIMGVSGCGKTSVGEAIAERLPVTFIDGDALHPQSNIDKMASGRPLDDDDRAPWLQQVGERLRETGGVVAIGCSALKRSYRDIIRQTAGGPVMFLHLHAQKSVLEDRVNAREGHFMPPSLLESQFATLEMLGPDEDGKVIDIDAPLPEVIAAVEQQVTEHMG